MKRFKKVAKICGAISTCEAAEDDANQIQQMAQDDPAKRSHSGCGGKQPKFKRNPEEGKCLQILQEWGADHAAESGQERKEVLSAERVHAIFKRISTEDMCALGFDDVYTRPEWMLTTILPVPPLAVRPMVEMDGMRSHDDLTFQLRTIVLHNNDIKMLEDSGSPQHMIDNHIEQVNHTVYTLYSIAPP